MQARATRGLSRSPMTAARRNIPGKPSALGSIREGRSCRTKAQVQINSSTTISRLWKLNSADYIPLTISIRLYTSSSQSNGVVIHPNMDTPQDITTDQPLFKIVSDESGADTIEPKVRRKSILKIGGSLDQLLVIPMDQQRRPSKRVSFADEDGGEIKSVLQLLPEEQSPQPQPQPAVRQSKCCQMW